MNFALYIAKRYLFSKSSNNAINIMTIIAASGTVIAAAALFIVLSGFAGLKTFSLEFSSFVDPDLKLFPSEGKSFLFTDAEKSEIQKIDAIEVYSKTIEERVILEFDDKQQIVTLKGVDENFTKVTAIDSMVYYGSWLDPEASQVVAGGGISNKLGFGILDFSKSLKIYVPKPGKGQITSIRGAFNSVTAYNVGVFDINEDLNNEVIFSDIETASYLVNYKKNQLSSIEFKLKDGANQAEVAQQIASIFGNKVKVKNRNQLNDALYKMLNTENVAVYLIFTLVIIIALFNVVGALIMMILDKKESLNTLFNLGTTTKDIRLIFFFQGSLMTVLAGVFGLIIGFVIVYLQQQFALVMITPSLPYPVEIQGINFVIVLATICTFGILASKLASQRISKNLVKS
ncbi:FtsX-like permease family protein [Subsaximicrobium wynnwilliamsii]|uniref:FtsX-like permease family protein n=1 Tax=Subsaximicrobium wynnwilliamsii TaxID=291179 RepID=A0A5C6ZHM4_9FLAO|nr:ABC transporter permease [Subsaximicrobium wynnwilliamsii]TXD82679.1 FtsX-like permease family protein [Subsaximicrobium wynnwilliamsii]TXD88414.1 FtsX-like permease family protein [Subsaximicrobium wynnwilliamsii]TXE02341.1 FtsX-like permease family protein [Subsaximicrobium wynnwilliamsii]